MDDSAEEYDSVEELWRGVEQRGKRWGSTIVVDVDVCLLCVVP